MFKLRQGLQARPDPGGPEWWLHPDEGLARVRPGFSWGAFAFGALWAIAHRLGWRWVSGLLILDLMVWCVTSWLDAQPGSLAAVSSTALDLGIAVFQGLRGQAWWRRSLGQRGYRVWPGRPPVK